MCKLTKVTNLRKPTKDRGILRGTNLSFDRGNCAFIEYKAFMKVNNEQFQVTLLIAVLFCTRTNCVIHEKFLLKIAFEE